MNIHDIHIQSAALLPLPLGIPLHLHLKYLKEHSPVRMLHHFLLFIISDKDLQ